MKNFDKWYGDDAPSDELESKESEYDWYNGAKHGWKAALEWIKTHDDGTCDLEGGQLRNIIEEELNE